MSREPSAGSLGAETRTLAAPVRPKGAEVELVAGQSIDRYVVLHLVGRGGMGAVYAAYDPKLDRQIALKVLRAELGGGSGEGGSARLVREAQTMAQLAHPAVVAVHDVGTFEGRVYVAMEFVRGQTLRAWLAQKARPWPEIVAAYRVAASGLWAAHRAGLVHRDFKPDNVLVGDDGRIRVADFGLARRFEPAVASLDGPVVGSPSEAAADALTQLGAVMGTPGYMAPEQLAGESADARSDQFSFCVSLYEALFGARPFASNERAFVAAALRDGRVPPEGARVPRWLSAAVLRGLAAEPAARHDSLEALADALARDPRQRRRRWALACVAAASVAAIVAPLVAGSGRSAEPCPDAAPALEGIWDDGVRASVRRAFGAAGVPYAAATAETVVGFLDGDAQRWVQARGEACRATRVLGEQSEELLDRRVLCLEQHRRELSALTSALGRAEAGTVRHALRALRALSPIERCADREELMARVRLPTSPEVRARAELVGRLTAEARVAYEAGRAKEGLERAREAVAESRTLGHAPTRAEALFWTAELEGKVSGAKAAEPLFFEAHTTALEGRHDRAAAWSATALVWLLGSARQRFEDARRWGQIAEALIRRQGRNEVEESDLAAARGLSAMAQGRFADAEAQYLRSLELRRAIYAPPHPQLANALLNLGTAQQRLGRFDDAARSLTAALAMRERAGGPRHPAVAQVLGALAAVQIDRGSGAQALAFAARALSILEAIHGADHGSLAEPLNNLGLIYKDLGQPERALAELSRARRIYERTAGPRSVAVAMVENNLGDVLLEAGRSDEARPHLERALTLWREKLGDDHVDVALALHNLGVCALRSRDLRSAGPALRQALAIRERRLGDGHPELFDTLAALGELARAEHRLPAAERWLERAEALAGKGTVPALNVARARLMLAKTLRSLGAAAPKWRPIAQAARASLEALGPARRAEAEAARAFLVTAAEEAKTPAE